jgi:hypothetical protein
VPSVASQPALVRQAVTPSSQSSPWTVTVARPAIRHGPIAAHGPASGTDAVRSSRCATAATGASPSAGIAGLTSPAVPVVARPALTASWSSRLTSHGTFVVTPATVVSSSAARSAATAASRSDPRAITLASIGS